MDGFPTTKPKRGPGRPPKQRNVTSLENGSAPQGTDGNDITTLLPSTIPDSNATGLEITQASSATLMPDLSAANPIKTQPTVANPPAKLLPRSRGRPKGSKDKPVDPSLPRKRGRPKGSKDKAGERKRPRGRPRKYPNLDNANDSSEAKSPNQGMGGSPEPLDAPSVVTKVPGTRSSTFRLGDPPSTYDADAEQLHKEQQEKPAPEPPKRGRGRPRKQVPPTVLLPSTPEREGNSVIGNNDLDESHISHRFLHDQQHLYGSISLSHFDLMIRQPASGDGRSAAASDAQLHGFLRLRYEGPAAGFEAVLPVGEELQFSIQGKRAVERGPES